MNKTYFYRKHMRHPIKFLLLFEGIIFGLVLLMLIGSILTKDIPLNTVTIVIVGIGLFFTLIISSIALALVYLLIYRRFQSISITLTPDYLVYSNSSGQIVLSYQDIRKLDFSSIKYTGGWMKIHYGGGIIRLTVVLENISDFISNLKEKLDERGSHQVYDEKKLFSFFKTATFSDESWARIYVNYKIQLLIHSLCLVLTIAILIFFGDSVSIRGYIYGGVFAPLVGYVVSEIIIGFQVKRRVDAAQLLLLPRNQEFERKTFILSILGFSACYLVILLLLMLG